MRQFSMLVASHVTMLFGIRVPLNHCHLIVLVMGLSGSVRTAVSLVPDFRSYVR